MTTKHTPGPWAYVKHAEPGNVVFDIHQADGAPYTRNLSDVAYSTYANELDGIQEANARLISAAPELLDSLIYLRNCIEDGRDPAMSEVNQTIAKATRGTQ